MVLQRYLLFAAAAVGPVAGFHCQTLTPIQLACSQQSRRSCYLSNLEATSSPVRESSVMIKEGSIGTEETQHWLNLQQAFESHEDQEIIENALSLVPPNATRRALGVASVLAELNLDLESVVAGILKCGLPFNEIPEYEQHVQNEFGSEIASLVQGIAEINATLFSYHQSEQRPSRETENYRKLLLSLAQDIRVVLIQLANQLQKVRMLQELKQGEISKRIAQETLELYAPLAHRLGMHTIKTELEDTSLKFWKPEAFRQLKVLVAAREAQRRQYTKKVIRTLVERLAEGGLDARNTVTGRAKSFFSIYQKMQQQNLAFDDIHDVMAFRVLVDDVSQCYLALGIVHSNWKPVEGRFKDYIALPKSNGYQSLHTTVIGPENKRMEVQIRTHDMHRIAEGGVAAHWMYKEMAGSSSSPSAKGTDQEAERYKVLRQLVEWAQHNDDDERPLKTVDGKLFEKEVFVFSPRGQLFALSRGATVLDFAYRIHSEIGHHCTGAKVNGKMAPLKQTLNNGDTIEVLQSASQKPNQEWLNIVHTQKAKGRIKSWLKREQVGEDSIALGREMLEKGIGKYESRDPTLGGEAEYRKKSQQLLNRLKFHNESQLLTALAFGQISVPSILEEVFGGPPSSSRAFLSGTDADEDFLASISESSSVPTRSADGVVVGGKRNILLSFCRNCNPLYGENVQGVVTQGRGVKVHRLDCRYLVKSDAARRVDAVWDKAAKTTKRSLVIEVLFEDAPGMLAAMSRAISSSDVNIGTVVSKPLSNGKGLARFEVKLSSIEDLNRVNIQLQQEPGVLDVKRR